MQPGPPSDMVADLFGAEQSRTLLSVNEHEAAVRAAMQQLTDAIVATIQQPLDSSVPDRLLSVAEAAHLLGLGRTRAYEEIAAGRLRSLKVGRRRLIPASALAEFIESRS